MEVLYSSTRNGEPKFTASQAILKGLADDGGLFVPDHIPALSCSMRDLSGKSYQEVAYEVMKLFFTDFTEEELKNCIERAYDSKFDTEEIAPLVEAEGTYYLELFHGATIAFKDMALSILPHLMITSAKKNQVENEIVILTATSGDTGKDGEAVNFVVPTGNFGNILAAFYARQMGVPIGKLICASNENKVLYDFFATGTYDRNREFVLTTSPSMDILISSNLERLIYRIAGEDAQKNAALMDSLARTGVYEITEQMREQLADFYGNYADEAETAGRIRQMYENTGYVLDTHTAVASAVYQKYRESSKDETVTVIASTASPFKFTRSVMNAIDGKYDAMSDFELVDELARIGRLDVPNAIAEIRTAPVVHDNICDKTEMKAVVKHFLGVDA